MKNILVVGLLLCSVVVRAESPEREIILRTMGGVAFTSGLAASAGPALGLEVEADMGDAFAMGALFSFASASANSPLPDSSLITFGLNPRIYMRKGSARIGFGAIVGAQIVSTDIIVPSGTSFTTNGRSSTTSLALGANASVEFPIVGAWNATFSPHFIYGTSSKASQVGLMGGFALILYDG